MSFVKLCELADKFEQKLHDEQLAQDELDAKTHIPSWVADPSLWIRAKKKIKKYFNKLEEPYGAITNLYFKMHGKKK